MQSADINFRDVKRVIMTSGNIEKVLLEDPEFFALIAKFIY